MRLSGSFPILKFQRAKKEGPSASPPMLDKPRRLWHPSAPMSELAKAYEPQAVEAKWYAAWIAGKCFEADPSSEKDGYSIVIPPPNVTGILHLGHVLNNALQDILARRARQKGKEVLWLPGTDHAGIATQAKVERELREKEGVTRRDLGREEFLKRVWDYKNTTPTSSSTSSSVLAARAIGAASGSPWTRPTPSGWATFL
jgi:tRNA synthetases class I (I, L, M and V)